MGGKNDSPRVERTLEGTCHGSIMSPSNQDVAIPIIDIREPCLEVAKQVLEAASTHGFLFIKNDHGIISSDDIADMFALVSHLDQHIYRGAVMLILPSLVNSSPSLKRKSPNTPSTPQKQGV